MKIKIKNLSFTYARTTKVVLTNLNAEIKEGTVNVVLGLNGSGKTTLIRLLAGLYKPDEGDIFYDAKRLTSIPIKERSKIFAYVSQHSVSTDDILVKDFLTFGFVNSLKFYESPSKEQIAKVTAIANKMQIEKLLNKNLGELSGGEKQIVSIAACLLQNTPILLLDEPTSALDLKNQNLVLFLLRDIAKEGKTVILSSHNPNHSLFLNSNVILLNNGKIEMFDESNKVVQIDILRRIYGDNLCLSSDLAYKEVSFKN